MRNALAANRGTEENVIPITGEDFQNTMDTGSVDIHGGCDE